MLTMIGPPSIFLSQEKLILSNPRAESHLAGIWQSCGFPLIEEAQRNTQLSFITSPSQNITLYYRSMAPERRNTQSRTSVRVTDIPIGTTLEQYTEFVNYLLHPPRESNERKKSVRSKLNPIKRLPRLSLLSSQTSAQNHQPVDSHAESLLSPIISSSEEWFTQTLAKSGQYLIGTITFSREESKRQAINRHEANTRSQWKDWMLSEDFDYITVLYDAGVEAEIDICAVHGLDGNAMDTWTKDVNESSSRMWLRDFLPKSDYFANSRVMTFGYDSGLRDPETVMTLDDWAVTLLDSVSRVRTSEAEKKRPIIFVCHSLGGLVTRKHALSKLPNSELNLSLDICGALFLATPHSGTTKADWEGFVTAIAGILKDVRPELIMALKSFSPASVWDKANFLRLRPRPQFICFAEGARVDIKFIGLQYVVKQDSATLDHEEPAETIMNTNHSTICKYSSNSDGGYGRMVHALNKIKLKLVGPNSEVTGVTEHIRLPGHPAFIAHAYPPNRSHWWEGTQISGLSHHLESRSELFGRKPQLKEIQKALESDNNSPKLTVLKGIGGIGKTRLLIEATIEQKGSRNVFFIGASASLEFEQSVAQIASNIGFDMIENHTSNRELWHSKSILERAQIFMDWLGHECNKSSILIIDDLDAYSPLIVQQILSCPAWHLVVSTRDSTLRWTKTPRRIFEEIRLSSLETEYTVALLKDIPIPSDSHQFSKQDYYNIASALDGHPLALSIAIPYILDRHSYFANPINEFLHTLKSPDMRIRKEFMTYRVGNECLWDCFQISENRLQRQSKDENVQGFLRILPFLNIESKFLVEFLKLDKSWLESHEDRTLGFALLLENYQIIFRSLHNLQKSSIIIQEPHGGTNRGIKLHHLIKEFLLLRLPEKERDTMLREMIILCHGLIVRDENSIRLVEPQLEHCLEICRDFLIGLENLKLPDSIADWLQNSNDGSSISETEHLMSTYLQNPFEDQADYQEQTWPQSEVEDFSRQCLNAQEKFQQALRSGSKEQIALALIRPIIILKRLMETSISKGQKEVELRNSVVSLQDMVEQAAHLGCMDYPDLLQKISKFRQMLE